MDRLCGDRRWSGSHESCVCLDGHEGPHEGTDGTRWDDTAPSYPDEFQPCTAAEKAARLGTTSAAGAHSMAPPCRPTSRTVHAAGEESGMESRAQHFPSSAGREQARRRVRG